jgi:YVTN family beta-propeller protein
LRRRLDAPIERRLRGGAFVKRAGLLLAILVLAAQPAAANDSAPGYHVVRRIALAGDGGWDYLAIDSPAQRLYIARASRVSVVDTSSGRQIGELPDTPGVHGVALAPELGRGYTSNGGDASVTAFELATLAPLGRIAVGDNPDAIVYDPATARVFTFNGRSHDASVIDAATLRVLGTIPLGGKPEFAVADGRGQVYANDQDAAELVTIDARSMTVRARWPLAGCDRPTGLAMDTDSRRLFVGCSNQVMAVVDADSGKIIALLPTGKGTDATAFDPGTRLAFSSNGEGTLTIVHEESPQVFRPAGVVRTQPGARTMALDSQRHIVYLATARFAPPMPPAAASAAAPQQRRPIMPGSFVVLVVAR